VVTVRQPDWVRSGTPFSTHVEKCHLWDIGQGSRPHGGGYLLSTTTETLTAMVVVITSLNIFGGF